MQDLSSPVFPRDRSAVRHLAAAVAVTNAGALPVFMTAALAVQLGRVFGLTAPALGIAVGSYFAVAALTSVSMGRVCERIGASRSLQLGALLGTGCMAALAAAQTFFQLVAILAAGGVANALSQPAANLFLTRVIHPRRQGLAFALKQSAIPAATMLGGIAVPALALSLGWRWAYVAGAILAAGAAALVPADPPLHPHRVTPHPAHRAPRGAMTLLTLGIGLGAAAAGSLASFVVIGAVARGIAEGPAGYLAAGGAATAVAARLVAGVVADRHRHGHLRAVAVMMLTGALGFLGLAAGGKLVFLCSLPLAFGAGWGWPGLFNLAVVTHNQAAPGAATGITQTGTYIGTMLGPVIFGAVAGHFGWPTAWAAAGTSIVLAAAAVLAARRRLSSSAPAPS